MALQVEAIRASLELIVEQEVALPPRFYARLFERHPQVRPLFGGNASERQQKMLQETLVAVVDHIEDGEWLASTLRGMGSQHVDYGVADHMYPWVAQCLLDTLREVGGDAWTAEYHAAWQEALGAICVLMLEGARARRAAA